MRFTTEEIKKWIDSLESYNDTKNLYSPEQILRANLEIGDKIWIPTANVGLGFYGTISSFKDELIFFDEFNEGLFVSELICDEIHKIGKDKLFCTRCQQDFESDYDFMIHNTTGKCTNVI